MTGPRAISSLDALGRHIVRCRRCPELRTYCAKVAKEKRRAYRDWDYWGRPVQGFGDSDAGIWILGLAPAAHGANRTGRMFTGDRSGDFLYRGLHDAGLATQPQCSSRDDGLELTGAYISAACRCAPPANKPTRDQLQSCAQYLDQELRLLRRAVVLLCLGSIAWDAGLRLMRRAGHQLPRPKPKFGHGAEVSVGDKVLLGCYHVSQQNTFTGRLTREMLDRVLRRAGKLAGRNRGAVARS